MPEMIHKSLKRWCCRWVSNLRPLPYQKSGLRRNPSFCAIFWFSVADSSGLKPGYPGRSSDITRTLPRGCQGVLILGLAAALAFDPHILLLSWSAERQETVAATSAATCTAAIDAIATGRWLADDPPVAMACRQGSAFPPGWDCIAGHNCPKHPIDGGRP